MGQVPLEEMCINLSHNTMLTFARISQWNFALLISSGSPPKILKGGGGVLIRGSGGVDGHMPKNPPKSSKVALVP